MKAGEIVGANRAEESGIMGHLLRITLGICLTVFLVSSAQAQYGGGGTGTGTGTPGTPRIRSAEERIRFGQSNRDRGWRGGGWGWCTVPGLASSRRSERLCAKDGRWLATGG